MTIEDQRTAVSLWVTLSSQVIAATLALIALQGAFTTFVLDKREPSFSFYLIVVVTFLLFIFSILSGGVGIDKMTVKGSTGTWNLDTGRPYFRRQTVVCLLGVLLFFLSLFFSGSTKAEPQSENVKLLQQQVAAQQTKLDSAFGQLEKLRTELDSSTKDVKNLQTQLASRRCCCEKSK